MAIPETVIIEMQSRVRARGRELRGLLTAHMEKQELADAAKRDVESSERALREVFSFLAEYTGLDRLIGHGTDQPLDAMTGPERKAFLDACDDGDGPYMEHEVIPLPMTGEAPPFWPEFKAWAEDNLGQGYSLAAHEGALIDDVTRACFQGYRAAGGAHLSKGHSQTLCPSALDASVAVMLLRGLSETNGIADAPRWQRDLQRIIELIQPLSRAAPTLQSRAKSWLEACIGEVIANDATERNNRFLEEALELGQACGCSEAEATRMVEYVYGRPHGDKVQEVGGVLLTLAALCTAHDIEMNKAGEAEMERVTPLADEICAKQTAKPKHLSRAAAEVGDGRVTLTDDATVPTLSKVRVAASLRAIFASNNDLTSPERGDLMQAVALLESRTN